MNNIIAALEEFINTAENGLLCSDWQASRKIGPYIVQAKRSACNTHWAEVSIKRDSQKVDALIDDDAGRMIMRTAIKRVYDAA